MPIRYMGTKRHVADRVRRLVSELKPDGQVLDLFSGVGCVAESLAGIAPVVTNDALAFTGVLARARFTGEKRSLPPGEAIARLRGPYREHVDRLTKRARSQIRAEQRALEGGRESLAEYMAGAKHVANNPYVARKAKAAAEQVGPERYCLTLLYFAAGYYSTLQAIHLDALRFAIDQLDVPELDRDWLLGGWLAAAAVVINAPGHTAQHLRPNTETGFARIRRYWRRNIWEEFQGRLVGLKLVGDVSWRRQNEVRNSEALDLLRNGSLDGVSAVYADPPYTKDQYSRYYHVYETLYRYDFPDAHGAGRARSDRFSTGFSLKTGVAAAFTELFDAVADRGIPLVLSYPSAGLLADAGHSVGSIAAGRMTITTTETFEAQHSTLGASQGTKTKSAMENLYVCSPV